MDFKKAMDCVGKGKTVRVCPASGEHPFLVKVGFLQELEAECLMCRCLTRDALYLEPDYDWEPVCYLLSFPDYLDGKWQVVDERDYKEVDKDNEWYQRIKMEEVKE